MRCRIRKLDSIEDKGFIKQQNKIQDRYSIRCAPQISGVYRDTLRFARDLITEELNSANDNPLVDIGTGRLYNTGNFYGGHICAPRRPGIAVLRGSEKRSARLKSFPEFPAQSRDDGFFRPIEEFCPFFVAFNFLEFQIWLCSVRCVVPYIGIKTVEFL